MKAFVAALVATVVLSVGAWFVLEMDNTAVDEVPAVASVRLQ